MGVTIKEIAQAAGVSRGTVDRALNNRPGVNPDVAERVRRLARDLGYRPNQVAKALVGRSQGSAKIGIIIVTENNSFYDDIIAGMNQCLGEYQDYNVQGIFRVLDSYSNEKGQLDAIRELLDLGARGIVLTPIGTPGVSRAILEATKAGVPFITVNSDAEDSGRLAYVGCDFHKSGEIMAGLAALLAGGRSFRVGAVSGPQGNMAVLNREAAFLAKIRQYPNLELAALLRNEANEEQSFEITMKMLTEHPELDLLCFLGAGMVGSLRALEQANREKRIRVAGYDAYPEIIEGFRKGFIDVSITQEAFEQGYRGVRLMIERLLFARTPERERNYTRLSVITRECLEETGA